MPLDTKKTERRATLSGPLWSLTALTVTSIFITKVRHTRSSREMDKRNRMTSLVSDAAWRFGKIAAPLGKALLFSAADEHISYKKDLCIAIEKGGVSVAYG